ncbi:crinkler (CRN) family protein, putative [Phytophthora infestans T30-4]|uniref:Crinkler (CRN) family protein, putative n=1 Tax=Phytophthora infestans (strain T30-4) TaxID=403677 RepID=D0NRF0_PHYIT|nr:crinkler (CRN) family protein, putative [Phytophthora infestans T30-4]EEY63272.1 crinkler (CRN) family protein, putative [Phytophthora infestans T30-4]|eukprot:XP_002898449.1 crinkler (CRN) family protein, putative [Phytophthora infestans T30-4]
MKSLGCVVVGDGRLFVVEIDERKKVGILKTMIKEAKMYKLPADQLLLYVAKKGGNWLTTDDPDVTMLETGEIPTGIINIMKKKENKMDSCYRVRNTAFGFPNEDAGEDGEIHVLVKLPEAANKKQRLEWRSTRWGSHAYDPNSQYFVLEKEDVDESGLLPSRMMLYCRPTFHRQFELLRDQVSSEGHLGWILGPPGTGKSTTAMAFASTVDRSEWIVTWIHVAKDMDLNCVRLAGEERKTRAIDIANVDEVLLVDDTKKHLRLVDGWTAADFFRELTVKCHRWLTRDLVKRRLAFVCSVASRGKVQEGTDIRMRAMEFDVWSWTLAEYLDAVKERDFLMCVASMLDASGGVYGPRSPAEMVELKYHYAGGSCRYMFDDTTTDVKTRLCRAVESTSSAATLSSEGHRSQLCINRLFAMFKRPNWEGTVSPLISRYAATTVGIVCGPEAIKKFMSTHRDHSNPALNGWMLEMAFFSSLRQGGLELVDSAGNKLDLWGQSAIVVSDGIPELSCARPVWIKPEKWNQGGYDAIMVCKRTQHVRLVQVTSAHKHSFRIDFFYQWLKMLSESPESFEVKKLEIFFVVEQDKLSAFEFTTTGEGLLDPFEWPKGKETELVQLVGIRGLYNLSQ